MNAFFAIFLPLLIAYGVTLQWCVDRWNAPTQYFAHCWLVAPVAAFVLWWRRAEWRDRPAAYGVGGWLLLAPALVLHLLGALLMVDSWSALSLILAIPGAAWVALGRHRLHGQWPVLWLSLFLVPAPMYVEGRLAFLLKEIAVAGGSTLANLLGAGVVRAGDRLSPTGLPGSLFVADACGGLRSLLAMMTMAWCLVFFFGSSRGGRRLLVLAAAPFLAIAANITRIAVLCLFARWFGVPFAEGTGHTLANAAEWLSLLLLLIGLDAWLGRRAVATAAAAQPPVIAPTGKASWWLTAGCLWLLAGPLLWLSTYRPLASATGRAERLPDAVAGYSLIPRTAEEQAAFTAALPRWRELLGTGDFVWRQYQDPNGSRINLVALFHDTNWKSVHPPRICIEGSNMDIQVDDLVSAAWAGEGVSLGRILARDRADGWRYLTLSAFGTADWTSGDYWAFTLHHLPRALMRSNMSGF
ncbi:MAG: exosortase/archaeosortase family protein, partial [Aquabacterium sp.]